MHDREPSIERTIMTARQTHFDEMTAELAEIPTGPRAMGQLCTIRLVNRDAFLSIPEVQRAVQALKLIINGMKIISSDNDVDSPILECSTATLQALQSFVNPIEINKLKRACDFHLKWDENSYDTIFKLFNVQKCPEFTYISHRWVEADLPFGKHFELLSVLALCPEQWFWLDYSCMPHTNNGLDNNYASKVTWNISTIITLAQNMITYYPVDGLGLQAVEGSVPSEVRTTRYNTFMSAFIITSF